MPLMLVSSPTNPEQVQPEQNLEDIFADSGVESAPSLPLVQTVAYDQPTEPTTEQQPRRRRGINRRTVLFIAIGVGSLLLLGGVGFGVYSWSKKVPAKQPVITITTPVVNVNAVNQAPVVNANTVVDIPTFIDSDHDGLSDQEELQLNTNPKKADTDGDGLSDREEVKVYLTDPRNPDTDGDGYSDGEEVSHFYDPNDSNPNKRLFQIP